MPAISGESRKRLIKHAETLAEQQQVAIRNIRQNFRKDIKKLESSQDSKKDLEKIIDIKCKESSKVINQILAEKVTELSTK